MKYQMGTEQVEAFRLPVCGDDKVMAFMEWADSVGLVYYSDRDEGIEFTDQSLKTGQRGNAIENRSANAGDWIVLDNTGLFMADTDEEFRLLFKESE
jgi:hypothetical protein